VRVYVWVPGLLLLTMLLLLSSSSTRCSSTRCVPELLCFSDGNTNGNEARRVRMCGGVCLCSATPRVLFGWGSASASQSAVFPIHHRYGYGYGLLDSRDHCLLGCVNTFQDGGGGVEKTMQVPAQQNDLKTDLLHQQGYLPGESSHLSSSSSSSCPFVFPYLVVGQMASG
jgi:hypothetical protein